MYKQYDKEVMEIQKNTRGSIDAYIMFGRYIVRREMQ